MKANKTLRQQRLNVRLLLNLHLQAAIIITIIIFLLIFASCSSRNPYRSSIKAFSDCEELLKKRNSQARSSTQPKIKAGSFNNKKTGTIAKSTGSVLTSENPPELIIPLKSCLESEGFSNREASEEVEHENVIEKEPSNKLRGFNDETKSLVSLPKPASVFSKPGYRDYSFLLYGLMLGSPLIISLLLLRTATPTFMRVSAWSAHHPLTSRMMLGGVHVGTGITGLLVGSMLGEAYHFVPNLLIASASGVFIVTSYVYPTGQNQLGSFSSSYRKQKFCDALLYSTGIALSLGAGNQLSRADVLRAPQMYQGITEYKPINASVSPRGNESSKAPQSDPVEKKNGKITLTILASLFFTAGILFVAAASCSLSCSGAGTGAVLVAVLGGAGFILAYVGMLKNIKKKYKVKRKHPKESGA